MEFGLVYSIEKDAGDIRLAFSEAADQISAAEGMGYGVALISEHHLVENDFLPSALIACAVVAARTRTIKVGPGVLLLPLFHPVHVAEDAAVLDVLSGGRLILGLGQGYRKEEFDAFGVSLAERHSRLREGATLIRRLWTEDRVTHEGRHWRLRDVPLHPKPLQKPAPPIWVAAKKASAVRLAGEVGDGWFADPITPLSIIRSNVPVFREAVRRSGRSAAQAAFALYREIYVGHSDAAAWTEARTAMMEGYRNYLRWGHLVDDEGIPIPPENDAVLEELARKRFILGGPETCLEAVLRLKEELGITHLIARMKFPGLAQALSMRSVRLFAEKVMPHV